MNDSDSGLVSVTVGATVSTQQPRWRPPQGGFEPLCGLGPLGSPETAAASPPRERPASKRVWASRLQGQAGIMAEVVQELRRRAPARPKRGVGLTDGERAWPLRVNRRWRGVPLGLDCPHVLATRWGAA